MFLSQCADPDCPNEAKVKELEFELGRKMAEIEDLRRRIRDLEQREKQMNLTLNQQRKMR